MMTTWEKIDEKIKEFRESIQKRAIKIRQQIKEGSFFKWQPISKKQKKIFTWWMPGSPVKDMDGIIADGAIRSGKSLCMSTSFVMWAMNMFDGKSFGICGKTIGSLRRNVVFWLKIVIRLRGYKVHDSRTENLLIITHNGKTNYFYMFGGKDERSQDLIQGITLAGVFLDEVALMPESFVNQAVARCSIAGSKFWFNCNPSSPMHFFKVNWIDKAKDKKLIYLHFTMDDNLSLTEEIKQRYKLMYFGVFFKRYILGLWVLAEGVIYDMWDDKENEYDEMPQYHKAKCRRSISIDYGTTNPMVFADFYDDGVTLWLDNETYWDSKEKGRQKTDAEYANDLMVFIGDNMPDEIILDPSAASFKAELRQRGLRIKDADNEVLDGIRMTATMIGKRRLKINRQNCPNILREMKSYIWDEKAKARGEEKPLKEKDHGPDAVRYEIKTKIKAWRLAS